MVYRYHPTNLFSLLASSTLPNRLFTSNPTSYYSIFSTPSTPLLSRILRLEQEPQGHRRNQANASVHEHEPVPHGVPCLVRTVQIGTDRTLNVFPGAATPISRSSHKYAGVFGAGRMYTEMTIARETFVGPFDVTHSACPCLCTYCQPCLAGGIYGSGARTHAQLVVRFKLSDVRR